MRQVFLSLIIFTISLGTINTAIAQSCEASPKRHAGELHGFITGKRQFTRVVDNKWVFTLEPAPFGWDIRLRDKDKMDLSQVTPPFRGAPNPREIYGWHFRNAANTAKNTGDVNAPQHLRLFQFSPSLSETGGFRPSDGAVEPDPNEGRGWLRILDMGLADLEPGERARMNYLIFHACLTWPKTEVEMIEEGNAKSPVYLDEEWESIFGCGLDAEKYELSAWVLPRMKDGDLDADDALDRVAPIIRKSDGRKGIVICRAGSWLSVIGYGEEAKTPLKTKDGEPRTEIYFSLAQYLDRTEVWSLRKNDNGRDDIILGRTEKAEVAITWNGKKFTHELLWVFVEP